MRTLTDLTKKDLGAVLYKHYLDNYCEDNFSFDNGDFRNKIESHVKMLKLTDEELKAIEEKIILVEEEGTDYESLRFEFKESTRFFLQVTAMYDYNGNCCTENYNGSAWADVGMFFDNYEEVGFDYLSE